jgi:hypothetical protein
MHVISPGIRFRPDPLGGNRLHWPRLEGKDLLHARLDVPAVQREFGSRAREDP